jgi:enoyl-[acyl-carrier protein] reductase I
MAELAGKRVAVFGVANEQSIAWHVARGLKLAGAEIHLGYQQRFRSRVLQLLDEAEIQPEGLVRCDVTDASEVEAVFAQIGAPLHGLIHSIAFAAPESFDRPIHENAAEDFGRALEVSAYSLLQLTRHALPYLAPEASVVAMTYLGSQRVVPGYRLMGVAKAALEATVRELAVELGPRGVRVNAISAGPVRTLAAAAVPELDALLLRYADIAPLRCTIDPADIADLATFLVSDGSRRLTGQVLFLDAGFSILAVGR